MTEQINKLI